MPSDFQIPSIRSFQMDSSSIGNLQSSVNLFRGDVNYSQKLFSMPGRTDNDGLDVNVAILYQSNVRDVATTWNREQPTGVLGMGWSLPDTSIALDDSESPTREARSYSLTLSGIPNRLVREPDNTLLFSMDVALSTGLAANEPVSAAVRAAFVERGLALSDSALVIGGDGWVLDDSARQQQFVLKVSGDELHAYEGGESYQLAGYRFWKISYYPSYERWSVTNDAGRSMSFGGLAAADPAGGKTSAGSSIEWGVRWTNAAGKALWLGSSAQTRGQQQYARVWHLASVHSVWGDSIAYGYTQTQRPVGIGGKTYTQACYLDSITDVFGRKARFGYRDKLWSNDTQASPREYTDPHRADPGAGPNGFQDRYETKFLHAIDVQHDDGSTLFSVRLHYGSGDGALAVANVAGSSGDTCKRILTRVELANADGASLPGFRFDYHVDTKQKTNLGALRSITWPNGGVATYGYAALPVPLQRCDRTATVAPASGLSAGTPRVWFGPDYAVTTWYNTGSEQLSLQIWSWDGQWISWQPEGLLASGGGGIDLSTLDVLSGADFVAITYQTPTDTALHLFRKDPARPAQWLAASPAAGSSGPTRLYPLERGNAVVSGGDRFVLVSQMSETKGSGNYDRFTWRWPTRSWTRDSFSTAALTWFTAQGAHYASLDATGNVSLFYLEPTLQWKTGASTTLTDFSADGLASVALVGAAAMLVVAQQTSANAQQQSYDLFLLRWDEDYTFSPVSKHSYVDRLYASSPTPWIPSVVSNALVAVAGHLIRFDGQSWLENDRLIPEDTDQGAQLRYAYGADYAVLVRVAPGGAVDGRVLAFDPDVVSGQWTSAPAQLSGMSIPESHENRANWPATGTGDYLVIGDQLFFRGTATDWSKVVASRTADIQQLVDPSGARLQLDAASTINEGPRFLACSLFDNSEAGSARLAVLRLKHGNVEEVAVIGAERIWTAQDVTSRSAGTAPGGPLMFASFPSSAGDFDAAPKFFLHRHAGDDLQGPLTHHAVTSITLDDGMSGSSITTFKPDPMQAASDPTGRVTKYFQTTVYPGGTETDAPHGSLVTTYLNGAAILTGENFYNSLDGMLESVSTRNSAGVELARITHAYRVYTQRAGHPTDANMPTKALYGAYVLETKQVQVKDGVTSERRIGYVPDGIVAPYTGQPAITSSIVMNGAGVRETRSQRTTYACEVYDACRTLHHLTRPVLSVRAVDDGKAKVTTAATATTLIGWPSRWSADVRVPATESDFAWTGGPCVFPFSSDVASRNPEGWQRTTRVQGRSPNGVVVEHCDGEGSQVTTIFAATLGVPVATFKGAARKECAYNSFEPYEDQTGWSSRGAQIRVNDAHGGSRSLCLPAASNATLSTAVNPAPGRTRMLLGFWYKTAEGYTGARSGWTIKVGSAEQTVPFTDTHGRWLYQTAGIPLPAGSEVVHLRASNQGSGDVLLDGVVLMPLGADLTARTFWHDTRLLATVTDAGGRTTRTLYDQFNRAIGAVGPDAQLKELSVHFLSRQASASGKFEGGSPNAELTLHPAGAAFAETFVDGGSWKSRWSVSSPATWRVSDRALVHAEGSSDALRWNGSRTAATTSAFFAELRSTGPLTSPVSVSFGDKQVIAWTPGIGWSWRDGSGQAVQLPLAAPPAMASQWLLMVGDGLVLFFGDGQLLFSRASTAVPAQGFSLSPGANELEITNLAAMCDPRLGLSYTDGAARTRQIHQLHGNDSRVMEKLYDALDRSIATTRVAPGSFGKGAEVATLQYRSTFVDVPAFIASLSKSWQMSGDVADYYAGQSDGSAQRSNDEGYPYHGTRYEDSSQKRELEGGVPGRPYAIHDVDTVTPEQRHTTSIQYGASTAQDARPAGAYRARNVRSPSGYGARFLADTEQRQISAVQRDLNGATTGQTETSIVYSDATGSAGVTATLKLPNTFANGPQSDPAGYARSSFRNSLSEVVRFGDNNSGTTDFVLDRKGQTRFTRTPLEQSERHFLYTKYDALGRTVEEGFVTGDWNATELAQKAAAAGWPSASDGGTVVRTSHYDGDGSDPTALGKLTQVRTSNAAPASDAGQGACTVTESWTYDSSGRVHTASMKLSGAASISSAVTYRYNNLNEVTEIEVPELGTITYQIDDQGHIAGIGKLGAGPADIASFTYTPEGKVQTETRGAAVGVCTYASPGWSLQQRVTVEKKNVFSLVNNFAHDGTLEHRQTTFSFPTHTSARSASYVYDSQRRLSAVRSPDGGHDPEAISVYDANGNIWKGTQGGAPFSATYLPGTDQLSSASLPNGQQASFRYRKDGRPDRWRGLILEYDRGLGTLMSAKTGDGALVRFARGRGGHKVLRQQGSSARVTFYGAGELPLVTYQDGAPQLCVWGPSGLIAVQGTELRYPLQDTQGTVFGVMDAAGNLSAKYDYLPFGGIVDRSGSEAGDWHFHFMGKEFDPTLGLYDFGARMYDPALRRFLTPDSARQYSSPYVFVANNPLNLVDPTGHLSMGARFGIGVAMALVAIGGFALTLVSGGASDAAAATLESSLLAAEGATTVGEGAALGATEATELVSVVGENALSAGKEALVSVVKNLTFMSVNSLGSSLLSGGLSSISYTAQHGNDFTGAGFGRALGVGAAQGAISGALGSLVAMPATAGATGTWSAEAQLALRALGGGAANVGAGSLGAALSSAINGQGPTPLNFLKIMATSFVVGAVGGAISGTLALTPETVAITKVGEKIVKASTRISRALDSLQRVPGSVTFMGGVFLTSAGLTLSYGFWEVEAAPS